MMLFDGAAYTHYVPTATIPDNLIAQGQIPPLVAVLIDNPNLETRSLVLPCYPPFAEFLAKELIPWIRKTYRVTANPRQTVIAGSSYGGLAATYAGLKHPEIFGKILSQSGSFWWKPEKETEWEWLTRQFALAPKLPLDFYLDVGLLEAGGVDDSPSQLFANRHMRDVLQAKGYSIHYREYHGGHEYVIWRGTLADGLLALIGTAKAQRGQ